MPKRTSRLYDLCGQSRGGEKGEKRQEKNPQHQRREEGKLEPKECFPKAKSIREAHEPEIEWSREQQISGKQAMPRR